MDFVRMRINVEAVNKLVDDEYRGNKSWLAEEVGVDKSYLNQILNKKVTNHSPKAIKGLLKVCERKKLDPKKYIFLGQRLKKINQKEGY